MNSVVTSVDQSQSLRGILARQASVLHSSEATINQTSPSSIVSLLNAGDITINDLELYDSSGVITRNGNNIITSTTDSSSNISNDDEFSFFQSLDEASILLAASLLEANNADIPGSQEQTRLNAFLESQIQQKIQFAALENQNQQLTQFINELGNQNQQQNQLDIASEEQTITNNTLIQTTNTAETNVINTDILTQTIPLNNTIQNTSIINNNITTASPLQSAATSAQIALNNAAQKGIQQNQEQHAILLNAEMVAMAGIIAGMNNIPKTGLNTMDIVPASLITPVAAIEKIQMDVDDHYHPPQQERAPATNIKN